MRKSISLKIFSIALVIIVLMAVVAGISASYLDRVSDEALELSHYYLPLSRHANLAARHASAEMLHFERVLNLRQAGAGAERVAAELKAMRERAAAADRAVEDALALIGGGEKNAEIEIASRDFLQIKAELPHIRDAHRDLSATLESFLKGGADSATALVTIEEQLARQRAAVSREIADVAALIDRLAADSAAQSQVLEDRAGKLTWGLTAAAILIGLILAAAITRSLVKPVHDLVAGTRAIQEGNLDVHLPVTTSDEIAALAQSFNHMVGGLKQKELIQSTFGKYVDPRIVRDLIENHELAQTGARRRMTIFFSDIEGFTSIAERIPAETLVQFLNAYFSTMAGAVREEHGIIDKYIGDSIMAFWGPPFVAPEEQAAAACRTALAQIGRLADLPADNLGLPSGRLNMRIGIATGEVTVGSIGSDAQKNFTVVGDPVNLASRLESANKVYGSHVVICGATRELAGAAIETRELDRIRVVGKSEPVTVHEVLGLAGRTDADTLRLRDAFEAALAHFRAGDLAQARVGFEACRNIDPQDRPSALFLERVALLEQTGLPSGWDGTWNLSEK